MITLSSDFGAYYPATMKGVILQRTTTQLIDISHAFPRGDIRTTAFWLREILPWFPPAVHLVVIDPGVGTDRAALAIRANEHVFVGPDNGVLIPVAHELVDSDSIEVFDISVTDPLSSTFHGRDVFAPAAADIHERGSTRLSDLSFLSPVSRYEQFSFPEPAIQDDMAIGEVLVIDGFGNVITNIPGWVLDELIGSMITVNGESIPVKNTYACVGQGSQVVTVGSHGNVELAVNCDRGDRAFGLTTGSEVDLSW